jgi:DtxR family Mn-dependent transcriptional regulator
MVRVSDLIDTTEMYLRTVFELEEEGVVPMRARIAERLGQSGPTVSQTVARMERDGLLTVRDDRHLDLTPTGRSLAERVMRRHRLAECLLVQVLGVDLADVHAEACRWEHVMSEAVEGRILDLLGHPTTSPFGNPIPGLDKLADQGAREGVPETLVPLSRFGAEHPEWVTVRRIEEPIQTDPGLMSRLKSAGALPGETVKVLASEGGGVLVGNAGEYAELDLATAAHVLVRAAREPAPA